MRLFWRLFPHNHVFDGKFDKVPHRCSKCKIPIRFDGEWSVWITKEQYDAKQKRKDDWLDSMKKLKNEEKKIL